MKREGNKGPRGGQSDYSSGCTCPKPHTKEFKLANWVVDARRCNYSAFNGYHYTPSDYSAISCKACGAKWRSKANYVGGLSDA